MKSCPTCNRTYPDDTLAFCLIDGSVLSAPFDPQTKQPYNQRAGSPPPTEVLHSPPSRAETVPSPRPQPTMPAFPPDQGPGSRPTLPAKRSSTPWLVIGAGAFVVLIIAGIAILLVGRTLLDGNRSIEQNRSESTSTANDNSQSQILPESSPSPAKLDVAGRWVGTSDEDAATLIINSSDNDSYEGTESIASTMNIRIAVDVQIDSDSRRITITETKILQGEGWNLGVNEGTISSDGLKMSGSAKDTKGKIYSWSFTKQIPNRKP
jgi:hypothetical protein